MGNLAKLEKDILEKVKREYQFNVGDIVSVHYKIKEKDKERIYPLEGIVIKTQGALHRKSFTIRRLAYGEAYEITFPYHSPQIDTVEVVKKSRRRPRRKRIYYIRGRVGKKASLT
ncbi:MAG: 50S ribosomal protein L19 [Candidatus Omnitrophica bacterium]|nr:50S ribosomal protein L19 [Candidatus Omnitrophota bacterium]